MSNQSILSKIDAIKIEVDKHRPFSPHMQQQLKDYFRIELTYTSNALEGNSMTATETKIVIEEGITIGGKTLKEHHEALGHSDAYSLMLDLATKGTITEQNILELHKFFYTRIDSSNAGIYRQQPVIISGTNTELPSPCKVPALMKNFVSKISSLHEEYHPVEYAALLHLNLVQIHPFIDGNGRTARLLMNLSLLQSGYFIAIIPPILRHDYHASIRTCKGSDPSPFIYFIAQAVYESGKDYLRMVKHLTTY